MRHWRRRLFVCVHRGLGLINDRAPIEHRGATMSLLYLVVYVLQAGTALGVGAVAASWGLTIAVFIAAAALTVMTGTVVALTWQTQRRSERVAHSHHAEPT